MPIFYVNCSYKYTSFQPPIKYLLFIYRTSTLKNYTLPKSLKHKKFKCYVYMYKINIHAKVKLPIALHFLNL